jgi:hypothetical protein
MTLAPLGVLATPPRKLRSVRAAIIFDEGGVRFAAENAVCSGDGVWRTAAGRAKRVRSLPYICLASEREVGVNGDVGLGGAWGEMEGPVWSRGGVGREGRRRRRTGLSYSKRN